MSVFTDAWDWSTTSVQDVINAVPGGTWAQGAVSSVANVLGDAAKTGVGKVLLTALASSLYVPLENAGVPFTNGALSVGPQLASVVFALPGVTAGDPFLQAYTQDLGERVQGLIAYFGGQAAGVAFSQAFTDQAQQLLNNPNFQRVLDQAGGKLGPEVTDGTLRALGIDAASIAKQFNVRADAAAAAINGWLHRQIYQLAGVTGPDAQFDVNGNPISPESPPLISVSIAVAPRAPGMPDPQLLRNAAVVLAQRGGDLDPFNSGLLVNYASRIEQGQTLSAPELADAQLFLTENGFLQTPAQIAMHLAAVRARGGLTHITGGPVVTGPQGPLDGLGIPLARAVLAGSPWWIPKLRAAFHKRR